jgi:hypothetical protein
MTWPPNEGELLSLTHAMMKHTNWRRAKVKEMTLKIAAVAAGALTSSGPERITSQQDTLFIKGEVLRLSWACPSFLSEKNASIMIKQNSILDRGNVLVFCRQCSAGARA